MALRAAVLGMVLYGVSASLAMAKPLPRYGVFVFSNLCRDQETDDLLGVRLSLLRFDQGDNAYFEVGEGSLTKLPAERVQVSPTGHLLMTVVTDIPAGKSRAMEIEGDLNSETFVLTRFLKGGNKPALVARQRDMGRKIGFCPR